MSAADKLERLARALFHLAFPEQVSMPEDVGQEIKRRLHKLDIERIRIRRGFPSVAWLGRQAAITLPAAWGTRAIDICLRPQYWVPDSSTTARILMHEAFHAQQYQQSCAGFGIGYLRPFVIAYLAHAATKGGGTANPLERPAYDFAATEDTCGDSSFRFWRDMWLATPLGPRLPLPMRAPWFAVFALAVMLVALGIAVVKPILDVAMLAASGLVFLAASLMKLFRW